MLEGTLTAHTGTAPRQPWLRAASSPSALPVELTMGTWPLQQPLPRSFSLELPTVLASHRPGPALPCSGQALGMWPQSWCCLDPFWAPLCPAKCESRHLPRPYEASGKASQAASNTGSFCPQPALEDSVVQAPVPSVTLLLPSCWRGPAAQRAQHRQPGTAVGQAGPAPGPVHTTDTGH